MSSRNGQAPDTPTVLVTGATGFLGSHVVICLLRAGYRVNGTLRDPGRAETLRKAISKHVAIDDRLQLFETDLLNDAGWEDAVEGCTYVIHVASPIEPVPSRNPDIVMVPARQGTQRVLKFAAKAKVRRAVVTSSIAAVCYGSGGRREPFTEADWTNPEGAECTPYILSKTLAERDAWHLVETAYPDLELTTINPSVILGPVLERDYGISPVLILRLLEGGLPALPRFGTSIVDVRDVAAAHVSALTAEGAAGERFLVGGGFMNYHEIADVLRRTHPTQTKRLTRLTVPSWAVRLFALFDRESRGVLIELDQHRSIVSDKAKRILGWKPRTEEEAIRATADSLLQLGLVKGKQLH